MQFDHSLYPTQASEHTITISVSNPLEKKSGLSSYTVYTIKGEDKEGPFEHERRYSDFDHVRSYLVSRWPGCFIPPIPIKKVIGKNDVAFIEQRRRGLEIFLIETSKLRHLWYSKEFQVFLRGTGDIEKQLKQLPQQNQEDIIKKYDQVFPILNGKAQDTMIIGRVLEFNSYIKKILPVLVNFKEMALSFIEAKNANSEQFSILLNYVLPEYEKSCLSVYCNQITEGKFIFNENKDEHLSKLITELKELLNKLYFEQLYFNLEQEERQIEAFLETFKGKQHYQQKLKDLKSKQKDLQLDMVKLNSGKQGVFASFLGSVESNKAKATKQLQGVKDDIKIYDFLVNLIILLLGCFQINRFRKDKLSTYFVTMRKIALFQIEFNEIRGKICQHVLQNHNLL